MSTDFNPKPAEEPSNQASPRERLQGEDGCIDVGWILIDSLDAIDQEAILAARDAVDHQLAELLPDFCWRNSNEVHEVLQLSFPQEPVEYLDWALAHRDLRGWDFVLIFVAADLETVWHSNAWAAISRSLDSVVISTARLDPRLQDVEANDDLRRKALARRLEVLVLRSLGLLSGLRVEDTPNNLMRPIESLAQLDQLTDLNADQLAVMRENLLRIADLRLEEEERSQRLSGLAKYWFYLKAGWRNRREILTGLWHARPWQFPLRLTKLTMASLSTLVVLMMSAEAWDLATNQTAWHVVLLSLIGIVVTTVYVTARQRLLVTNHHRKLTEQIVSTRLTTVGIVAIGIATTYVGLFALTLLLAVTFFQTRLVASWAASLPSSIGWEHYLIFAGFVSAMGILIGAMGASFEGQHYFRHVTLIDEEI